MAAIWLQLEQEDKVEHVFYDGSVRDVTGWLAHLKQPRVFPLVVADMDAGKPVHVAWLTDVCDGVAWVHHAALGKYRRGAWEAMIEYWDQTPLHILLGMTPETNEKSIKFMQKVCKSTIVGIIPQICNLAYEARRVGGVIGYCLLKEIN